MATLTTSTMAEPTFSHKTLTTTTIATESVSSSPEERSEELADWPYEAGFKSDFEQHTPVELKVRGHIPPYVAGILYRTGPANYQVITENGNTWEADHWFDGLTTVHRFDIRSDGSNAKVSYRSRRTCDELLEHIRKNGAFKDFSFAQKRDPCQGFFKKVMSTFKAAGATSGPPTKQNIGVTLTANMPGLYSEPKASSHSTGISSLITKTDNSSYQRLDPDTLEPMGACRQTTLHPDLKGPVSGAHSKTCPITGDVFNFNLEFGPKTVYRIFQASPTTGKVKILASFEGVPAYLHSIFLTQTTVVLCVWNSHFTQRGVSILLNQNILDSIAPMDKEKPATWFVIDRSPAQRGLIATYTSPAFFAFHSTNAWEEPSVSDPSQTDIIAEIPTYDNLAILHRMYYENLLPKDPSKPTYRASHPDCAFHLARYRLPAVPISSDQAVPKSAITKPGKAKLLFKLDSSLSPELPVCNPRYSIKPHRYVYGIRDTGRSGFFDGLIKTDTQMQTAEYWSELGQTAGEPIFVPAPREDGRGLDEDEGVLLSVVLDGFKGHSYLLCLDAKTMKELGRADVDGVVGFGFHGLHVPEQTQDVYNGGD